MKYDYLIVREPLPKQFDGNRVQSVFDGIEGIGRDVEVMSISVVQGDGGLFAYAACRVPEQRKAGTK